MTDIRMWQDKRARAEFEARAKGLLADLRAKMDNQSGVIAIEPESGDYFIGATLGKADKAAFAKYPDRWLYFARLDDPDAAISLPTW